MSSKNSAAVDFAQYAAARTVSMLLGLFPVNANLRTARAVGSLIWQLDAKHRKRAMENLRASFPEKRDPELAAIAQRSMQHFIELAMDVFYTPRLIHIETWHKFVHLRDFNDTLKHVLRGRGAIMITGHYGNWEVLGYSMATLGFESYAVARPIDNPYIDAWLLGVRQKKGQIVLSKRGVTTTAQDVLENRQAIGFIADQNAGPKGMFVPFFGRLASTYKSIGLLAIQYNVPVIIAYARRRGDRFEFDIGIQDIIWPEDWTPPHFRPSELPLTPDGRQQDELYYITARYTKGIEDFVRADPTQYLWIHRRWKSRPKWETEKIPGTG